MVSKQIGDRPWRGVADEFMERLQQHQRYLFHVAYRLTGNAEDAKDLTQETLWQAHRKSNKYVYEKSLKAWLRTLMTNRFRDQKRKKSLNFVTLDDAFIQSDPSPATAMKSVEEQVEQKILLERIKEEIQELPDIYRRVIILRHYHGYSYTEISKELDIPEGTVKTQLFRSRKMLKERLSRKI
ncbi:RNA polymerase sigma factor [Paenactinomyces guangxiensis]|uniref:RNA polymerase sigma factor n=1 Tax=Paenactinomyces guangxiensis TaxID=1490290 RepID=A0A7W2A5Z1_9BACL|nr:RNA polymerase sigma factor [Paenactinomyces guangxiensis]MBA4492826.1 RNA polymerase sigma factor [Paenactinomyces guangxiensis]MBH8590325.1 RNA polymerase sigma factor [Paenactinomyces guangxiensis]